MTIDILQTSAIGLAASIVWFLAGGILYMNPFVAKMYKNKESSPALKKWQNLPLYLGLQYLGILIQCMLWAFVFAMINPILPTALLEKAFIFGIILVAIKIFPRFFDTWIQSTYPTRLLAIEFINGSIGGFIIGFVFAYLI